MLQEHQTFSEVSEAGSGASIYEDGTYLKNNAGWHVADSPFKARWIDAILQRNNIAPKSIAEIGCGAGEILVELRNRRPAATFDGFDISPQAIGLCASKQCAGLRFHHDDLLDHPGMHFDALIAADVFEHVPDYMGFIAKMKPLAEYKIFHIPLDLSVQGLLRGTPYNAARESIGHLHYFFKDTALATLRDCGLEVVDWDYTCGAEMLPRALKTRIANLPRKLACMVSKDLAARLFGGYSLIVVAR